MERGAIVADSVTSEWYYAKRGAAPGQHVGPFTWEQLYSHAWAGTVAPDDLVWNPSLPQWLPAAEIRELFPASALSGAAPLAGGPAAGGPADAAPGYYAPLSSHSTMVQPAPRRRSWRLPALIAVIALIVVGGGLGSYFAFRTDATTTTGRVVKSSTTTSPTTSSSSNGAAFVQKEGEIFLEAAGTAGPESFGGETFVPAGPTSTLHIPTSTTKALSTTTATGTGVQVASYSGDTPALYGGSKSEALADKEGQLRFLEANPDKAAAFCAALNSDPTLRWSGGNQVQPSQLRAYFDELTPVMLTRDTRVTNYGYRDGRPTPRQSVLQAGQMVLVDRHGVPRVRCECGNPLTPPNPVQTKPHYTGPQWPGFDPATIITIEQTTVIIDIFVVVDIHTGDTFVRPAGTSGAEDTAPKASVWEMTVEMTRHDTENSRVHTMNWKAEITATADGTLSGTGQGTWHGEGITTDNETKVQTGTWIGDASFAVSITGVVVSIYRPAEDATGLGYILQIQPTLGEYTLDNIVLDSTSDKASLEASFKSQLPDWLNGFTELTLKAASDGPLSAAITAGKYTGTATLTPVR
jgi:hypothetical protein